MEGNKRRSLRRGDSIKEKLEYIVSSPMKKATSNMELELPSKKVFSAEERRANRRSQSLLLQNVVKAVAPLSGAEYMENFGTSRVNAPKLFSEENKENLTNISQPSISQKKPISCPHQTGSPNLQRRQSFKSVSSPSILSPKSKQKKEKKPLRVIKKIVGGSNTQITKLSSSADLSHQEILQEIRQQLEEKINSKDIAVGSTFGTDSPGINGEYEDDEQTANLQHMIAEAFFSNELLEKELNEGSTTRMELIRTLEHVKCPEQAMQSCSLPIRVHVLSEEAKSSRRNSRRMSLSQW